MTTEAQIKANRKNALKSTGPKSDEGKQRVSQNALKHGLSAVKHLQLSDIESPVFNDSVRDLDINYPYTDSYSQFLKQSIASCMLRLQRLFAYDTLLWNFFNDPDNEELRTQVHQLRNLGIDFKTLPRYEKLLNTRIDKCINELQRWQLMQPGLPDTSLQTDFQHQNNGNGSNGDSPTSLQQNKADPLAPSYPLMTHDAEHMTASPTCDSIQSTNRHSKIDNRKFNLPPLPEGVNPIPADLATP